MLKEFVEELARQAVAGQGPSFKEYDPTKNYVIRDPAADGGFQFLGGDPSYRQHKAEDLETIASFYDRYSEGAAVWYSRNGITLLIDDADRKDQVSIAMQWSDQIKKLMDLEKAKPLIDQKATLHMLRTVFTPNAFVSCDLIQLLRKVKFTANSESNSEVARGKSSVGRALAVEASFVDQIPEQVTFTVPVFFNSFARRTQDVICAVEIWEAEQKLQIFPLPGEVEKAFAAAEASICQSIMDLLAGHEDARVYYGRP